MPVLSKEDRVEKWMSKLTAKGGGYGPEMFDDRETTPVSELLNGANVGLVLADMPPRYEHILRSSLLQDPDATLALMVDVEQVTQRWATRNRWALKGVDLEGVAWLALYRVSWRSVCKVCKGRAYRTIQSRVVRCRFCYGSGERPIPNSQYARLIGVSEDAYARTWKSRIGELNKYMHSERQESLRVFMRRMRPR